MKINRLIFGLIGLALLSGCQAGPLPGAAWGPGGRVVGASLLAHPNLIAAPAPLPADGGAEAPWPASNPTALPTQELSEPAPSESAPVVAADPQVAADTQVATLDTSVAADTQAAAMDTQGAGAETTLLRAGGADSAGPAARRVPILEYHYSSFEMLPSVSMRPEWFQAQIQWLAQAGFRSLSSAELAGFVSGAQAAEARSVALTFDVGASHFDEYTHDIIPTLRRFHLRAIFFVLPSQTRDTCDGRLACWPSLLAWRDEGLISIESHSFMHEDYARLSPERLAFDVARSKAAIEARTGQPVLGLCYPFDSVAPAARDLLSKAGYQFAVAGATRRDRSAQWNDPQPYALPRYYPYSGAASYPLIGGTRGLTFEQMMMGAAQ